MNEYGGYPGQGRESLGNAQALVLFSLVVCCFSLLLICISTDFLMLPFVYSIPFLIPC